jgi:hypothetical protein
MLNKELTALIPDEPHDEFCEVGEASSTLRQRLMARTVLGYQGLGRRVWIRGNASAGSWIVLDNGVERVHCQTDSEQIVERIRPTSRVVADLGQFGLTVTDKEDGSRSAVWHHNGRSIVALMKNVGPFIIESVAVADGPTIDEAGARQALKRLEEMAQARPYARTPCLGRWIGLIWSLAFQIPWLILFIFGGFFVGWLLGPDPLPLVTMFVGAVLYLYICTRRANSALHNFLVKTWSVICANNGDRDGTILRALASFGRSARTHAE